jgi:hypothetical protein
MTDTQVEILFTASARCKEAAKLLSQYGLESDAYDAASVSRKLLDRAWDLRAELAKARAVPQMAEGDLGRFENIEAEAVKVGDWLVIGGDGAREVAAIEWTRRTSVGGTRYMRARVEFADGKYRYLAEREVVEVVR